MDGSVSFLQAIIINTDSHLVMQELRSWITSNSSAYVEYDPEVEAKKEKEK